MQHSAPWELVASKDPKDITELDRIIYLCAEALRVCGILLQPYMPNKMAKLLDMLEYDLMREGSIMLSWEVIQIMGHLTLSWAGAMLVYYFLLSAAMTKVDQVVQ
jgi:methionyl-tRNA synthetase